MSAVQRATVHISQQVKNHALNAFITRADQSTVLAAAEAADQRVQNGRSLSPIDGRLIGIKDNVCTEGSQTTCASNILKGYRSPFPATVVRRLEAAGTIIAGKTNLDEFGMGSHSIHSVAGPTGNPIRATRGDLSPGGSSGGSAAAVASDQCWAALGTDTGGSVRLPASYCGVVGFKPSYGRLSRYGVVAYANSLDTVGILAHTSHDACSVYEVLDRYDPMDPTSLKEETRARIHSTLQTRPIRPQLHIGVPLQCNVKELDAGVRETWTAVLQALAAQGHAIVPVSLPSTRLALAAYYVLAPAEAASNLAKYDGTRYGQLAPSTGNEDRQTEEGLYSRTRGVGLGEEVRRRILLGAYTLSAGAIENYFLQAQRVRRMICQDFDQAFALPNTLRAEGSLDRTLNEASAADEVDVLIAPTAPSLPPTLDAVEKQSPLERYRTDVLTVPASLAGLPAISVPAPTRLQDWGEPSRVGLQVIGQFGDDELVLRVAELIEAIERE